MLQAHAHMSGIVVDDSNPNGSASVKLFFILTG